MINELDSAPRGAVIVGLRPALTSTTEFEPASAAQSRLPVDAIPGSSCLCRQPSDQNLRKAVT